MRTAARPACARARRMLTETPPPRDPPQSKRLNEIQAERDTALSQLEELRSQLNHINAERKDGACGWRGPHATAGGLACQLVPVHACVLYARLRSCSCAA